MIDYNIYLPTDLEFINPSDDNIDVIISFNGRSYVLVVATPNNLYTLMKKEGGSFISASPPLAFVEEITIENIEHLVATFCENDAFWLKYYCNYLNVQ